MITWDEEAFIGGHPALDFLNTVDDQDKQRQTSRITDWPSFVAWGQASSMFSEVQIDNFKNEVENTKTESLLANIHMLRETVYAAFTSVLTSEKQPDTDMLKLETLIKTAISNASLITDKTGYRWVPDTKNADWITDVLILSIERLLRSEDILRLKECKRCSWMFLNKGRGKGRQWCNMNTCGNRAKSASFRNRTP